jgi:hypothetical protein
MVASRLRDAWDIDLRWSPPSMPAWDSDRRLARLLSSVQIVPGLDPALSSEDEITAAIQALPSDIGAGPDDLWPLVDWPPTSPPSGPSGPVVYQLPAETAADALDRIFTVWVTQVRPQLSPDLTQPADSSDPAVLLASITFTLGPITSPPGSDPAIASCDAPDDSGRPYVLHTRLIQELRLLAEAGAAAKPQELATLTSAVDDEGQLILTAWFHLDQPVALTQPVLVVSRSGASGSFEPSTPVDPSGGAPPFSDVWTLTPSGEFPAIDQDQVAVSFVPASVLVGDPATSLADRIAEGLNLLDTAASGPVVIYGTVGLPPSPPAVPPPPPTREFVTITPLTVKPPIFEFELWFHPQPEWPEPQVFIFPFQNPLVEVVEERTGQPVLVHGPTPQQPWASNIWQISFQLADRASPGVTLYYFRFVFHMTVRPDTPEPIELPGTRPLMVTVDYDESPPRPEEVPLVQWMEEAAFTFLNWDPVEQTVTAYVRQVGLQ